MPVTVREAERHDDTRADRRPRKTFGNAVGEQPELRNRDGNAYEQVRT